MMYSRMLGTRRIRSAVKRANCVRVVADSGVVRLPKFMTVATTRIPWNSPAAATELIAAS